MASIQKRGERSFLLVVEAGYDAKGKRKRRTKTIRIDDDKLLKTTKKLRDFLELELAKFQMEVESGDFIVPEKTLLSDFVKLWENKYAVKELSETVLPTHLSHIKNHILPALGNMRIDKITPIHIIDMLDNMKRADKKDKPISIRTKQDVYLTMRNIMQRAVEWKLIKENPAIVNKPKDPNKIDEEVNVYDEKEVEALFIAVQDQPFHWRVFLTLSLAAGLRRSENLALEWSNIDLDEGTIKIQKAITRGRNGANLKGTKSKKSKRTIYLPDSVVEELKEYKVYWDVQKKNAGDKWIENEHEWLFCNIDGTHFYPTSPTTWWRRFLKKVGIRHIRLHDLRHTSATLLINQGVHAKVISERLGHSNFSFTMNTYGHAIKKADKDAASKLDDLFKKNKLLTNC